MRQFVTLSVSSVISVANHIVEEQVGCGGDCRRVTRGIATPHRHLIRNGICRVPLTPALSPD